MVERVAPQITPIPQMGERTEREGGKRKLEHAFICSIWVICGQNFFFPAWLYPGPSVTSAVNSLRCPRVWGQLRMRMTGCT